MPRRKLDQPLDRAPPGYVRQHWGSSSEGLLPIFLQGVQSGPFISAGGRAKSQALHPASKAKLGLHPHLPKFSNAFVTAAPLLGWLEVKHSYLRGGVGFPSPDKITAALNIKCQQDSASHPVPISGAGLVPPSPQALQAGCCAEIVCSLCAPGLIRAWQAGALIKAEGRSRLALPGPKLFIWTKPGPGSDKGCVCLHSWSGEARSSIVVP